MHDQIGGEHQWEILELWGSLKLEECNLHINILELKAALFGLQTLCKNMHSSRIFILIDNTSGVAAINKIGSTNSQDMDQIAQEIWTFVTSSNSWITATHVPGIYSEEADKEPRR